MKEVTKGAYITCVVVLIFTLLVWSSLGNMTCLAIGGTVAKDGIENSEDSQDVADTGFNTMLSYIICHIVSFLLWLTSIIVCSVFIHKYRTQNLA